MDDRESKIPDPPGWFKWLPIIGILLSLTILMFQYFVLHSWHIRLGNQMRHVKGKI